jgi:hypothetical protein
MTAAMSRDSGLGCWGAWTFFAHCRRAKVVATRGPSPLVPFARKFERGDVE